MHSARAVGNSECSRDGGASGGVAPVRAGQEGLWRCNCQPSRRETRRHCRGGQFVSDRSGPAVLRPTQMLSRTLTVRQWRGCFQGALGSVLPPTRLYAFPAPLCLCVPTDRRGARAAEEGAATFSTGPAPCQALAACECTRCPDDGRRTPEDKRNKTHGGRQTTDDRRRTTDDGRWMTDDVRRTTDDGRKTTDDGQK